MFLRSVLAIDVTWVTGSELFSINRGCLGERRVDVAEVLDAWLAPDYRYFKLRGAATRTSSRHDERSDTWELTMFRAERV